MVLGKLVNFIKMENERLVKRFDIKDKEKRIFATLAKISEEEGELSGAVLSYLKLQRRDKTRQTKTDVSDEVADVLITTMLLADQLGIDIEKCLESKIKRINDRYK